MSDAAGRGQLPPFLPDYIEAREDCRWALTEVPGLRMNEAFIAAPRSGEDRARWLSSMQAYRQRIRAGTGAQRAYLVFEGRKGWVRLAFAVSEALGLLPGDRLTVGIEARLLSGGVEAMVAFDCADPVDERDRGRSGTGASVAPAPDGEWHRAEVSIAVPNEAVDNSVIRPVVEFVSDATRGAGRLEVRRIDLVPAASRQLDALRRAAPPGSEAGQIDKRGFAIYDRPDMQWASRVFTCHFTFLYDRSIHDDKGWQVERFLRDGKQTFGGYDAVVLWHAYPRIGIDGRNQLDHYRDMPGGLAGLREMAQEFHARGVRVFVAYNPWDRGTRREGKPDEEALAEIVVAIDADGIFLDTMLSAPAALRSAIDAVRPGVVFAPEGHPSVDQLSVCNLSWAQGLHDPSPPGALRLKWIEPRHIQHQIRRWDSGRQGDIETAFFNGSGMLVWENVFGVFNPWSAEDARLWKRCAGILRSFAGAFSSDDGEPFVPTLSPGVFANRWHGEGFTVFTLRNTGSPLEDGALLEIDKPPRGVDVIDIWNARPARLESSGGATRIIGSLVLLGCFFVGRRGDAAARSALKSVNRTLSEPSAAGRNAAEAVAFPRAVLRTRSGSRQQPQPGMLYVPGGRVDMKLSHQRRECGCHPDPGSPPDRERHFLWGSPFQGSIEHDYSVNLPPFLVDEAQVSNGEYKLFLDETGFSPRDPGGFLAHWKGGVMPDGIADLPVVFVDLDDARAYASWAGKRLPTEPEWQLAAQGQDGREWPWGGRFDPARCAAPGAGPAPVRSHAEGRSPCGCYHMSGNVWEWTESERDDGHTRWSIVRGGSWFRPQGSLWYVPGGPQACTSHTKLILMSPCLDRGATIGFRCVVDLEP